jgi:hypothetical protein
MTSVFLVGDTSSRWNWGCRATTAALSSLIEEYATLAWRLDTTRLAHPTEVARSGGTRAEKGRSRGTSWRGALPGAWSLERWLTDTLLHAPRLMNQQTSTLLGLRWANFEQMAELISRGSLLPSPDRTPSS